MFYEEEDLASGTEAGGPLRALNEWNFEQLEHFDYSASSEAAAGLTFAPPDIDAAVGRLARPKVGGFEVFYAGPVKKWGLRITMQNKHIDEDTPLFEYGGELREDDDDKPVEKDDYIFTFEYQNRHFVLDACSRGNLARFVNHSCMPNCYTRLALLQATTTGDAGHDVPCGEDDAVPHLMICASRKILAGEELTLDYEMVCNCAEGQICDDCKRKRRVQEVNSRKKIVQNCPGNHFHPGMNALKASDPALFKLAYRRVTSVINKIIDGPHEIVCEICNETFEFYTVEWECCATDFGWGAGRTLTEIDDINQKELSEYFQSKLQQPPPPPNLEVDLGNLAQLEEQAVLEEGGEVERAFGEEEEEEEEPAFREEEEGEEEPFFGEEVEEEEETAFGEEEEGEEVRKRLRRERRERRERRAERKRIEEEEERKRLKRQRRGERKRAEEEEERKRQKRLRQEKRKKRIEEEEEEEEPIEEIEEEEEEPIEGDEEIEEEEEEQTREKESKAKKKRIAEWVEAASVASSTMSITRMKKREGRDRQYWMKRKLAKKLNGEGTSK